MAFFFTILHMKFGIVPEFLEACKESLPEMRKKKKETKSVAQSRSQFRKT